MVNGLAITGGANRRQVHALLGGAMVRTGQAVQLAIKISRKIEKQDLRIGIISIPLVY